VNILGTFAKSMEANAKSMAALTNRVKQLSLGANNHCTKEDTVKKSEDVKPISILQEGGRFSPAPKSRSVVLALLWNWIWSQRNL